jgi:Rrf2 family protein
MISRTAGYALRAVIHIAQGDRGIPVRVNQIARDLRLPQNYLSKTMHALARGKILRSARGKTGGFELAVAPEKLSLLKVVRLFDDYEGRRCLLGKAGCGDRHPCAAHWQWQAVSRQVAAFLKKTTVADVVEQQPAPISR